MHRQADNLARCARAVLDGTPDELDPLRAALLAYDAARQDTLRLAIQTTQFGPEDSVYYAIKRTGDVTGPAIKVYAQRRATDGIDDISAHEMARRIAASVNLLAHVPLDSLERLDSMSDAPAVVAAKVRQMEGRP